MRIALVEDEKKLAQILQKGLRAEGYIVDIYFDGITAESELKRLPDAYDILIFDLALPHRSGLEICQSLRLVGTTTPVLILTARNSLDDKITLLDAGADDFMTKPFDFDELLARLRAILRRPRQALHSDLTVADLILSPNAQVVTRMGTEIPLTVKEFQILHYLLRNTNRVVTREELFKHVWVNGSNSVSNVLDVHVKNLRDKVDHNYAHKLVQTIRGVGYTIQT